MKEKESKNSAATCQEQGTKKKVSNISNFISPAPIPSIKINGVTKITSSPVRGCTCRCVSALNERKVREAKPSARLVMRWLFISTTHMYEEMAISARNIKGE